MISELRSAPRHATVNTAPASTCTLGRRVHLYNKMLGVADSDTPAPAWQDFRDSHLGAGGNVRRR